MTLSPTDILAGCELVYRELHRPELIRTDPIRWPRRFADPRDSEFAGLVAAVFAIGRVQQIDGFLEALFGRLPDGDFASLRAADLGQLLQGLYYRFFTTEDIVALVAAAAEVLRVDGSFQELVAPAVHGPGTLGDGLAALCATLRKVAGRKMPAIMLPNPQGTAKRLRLFARWMIRRDDIDLGHWVRLDPAVLEYPLDTHLFRVMSHLGIARVASPGRSALDQIDSFFREHCPEDPVKWDFSLTRIGIGASLGGEQYRQSIENFFGG